MTVSDLAAPWLPDLPTADQDAARYTWRTGWAVNQDALALYRLRWGLNDVAEFLSEIRGPHQLTADTLVSWTALQEILASIAEGGGVNPG